MPRIGTTDDPNLDTTPPESAPPEWHHNTYLVVAAGVLGVIMLIAQVMAVVSVSNDSTRPIPTATQTARRRRSRAQR